MKNWSLNQFGFFMPAWLAIVFSDLYLVGFGRPFDYIALAIIIIFFSAQNFRLTVPNPNKLAFFWIFCVFISLPSFLNPNIGALAFLTGAVIFYTYGLWVRSTQSDAEVRCFVGIPTVIITAFLFIQVMVYYCFDHFIDFSEIIGSLTTRGMNTNIDYMRPSGLFQEPNSYVAVLAGLLFIGSRLNCSRLLFYSACLSIFLAQSIWGFGVLVFLILHRERMLIFQNFFLACLIFMTIGGGLLLFLSLSGYFDGIMVRRLLNIGNDPSVRARLGFLIGEATVPVSFLFYGNGIDTLGFQKFGASGFSFLLYSFGGILSFVFTLMLFNYRLDVWLLGLFLCYLVTFPLFSYMYFWIYFGFLAGRPLREVL